MPRIEQAASNVTDEVRREFYRKALLAKIAAEDAQATAKSKLGGYRSVLKDAKKAGVDQQAIANTLAVRFSDADALVISVRENMKMLDLSGVVPGILDMIISRYDVQEATANEQAENERLRAFDLGAQAGRNGVPADSNPHAPGSEAHAEYHRGWISGQAAIADELAVNAGRSVASTRSAKNRADPAPAPAGATEGAASEAASRKGRPAKAGTLTPDTAEKVRAEIANDDAADRKGSGIFH